jgi:hypothetical protein
MNHGARNAPFLIQEYVVYRAVSRLALAENQEPFAWCSSGLEVDHNVLEKAPGTEALTLLLQMGDETMI